MNFVFQRKKKLAKNGETSVAATAQTLNGKRVLTSILNNKRWVLGFGCNDQNG